jgi:cytochrome P450
MARDLGQVLAALARAFLRNPTCRSDWQQFYAAFRGVPPLPIGDDEWIVTRWEDVQSVMRHESAELVPPYPSSANPEVNQLLLGMLPHESGAKHRRLRALTQSALSAAALARLEGAVRGALDELLYPATFTPQGCDVHATLGLCIPEQLSCLLLGVAPDDRAAVTGWSHLLYREIGRYDHSPDEVEETSGELAALRDHVMRRARQPLEASADGVGAQLFAAHRNGHLDDDQLVSYFVLFLLAGQDTVTYALTNAVCFVGSSPGVFARLTTRRELAAEAFDEAMRLWGPIRLCVRTMTAPLTTQDASIPAGARVFAMIHAANRDPRRHDHPDEFRWGRGRRSNLAYGAGPHGCLGGGLGALVGRVLFESLGERCASVRATPSVEEARFVPSLPILGIEGVRLFASPAA